MATTKRAELTQLGETEMPARVDSIEGLILLAQLINSYNARTDLQKKAKEELISGFYIEYLEDEFRDINNLAKMDMATAGARYAALSEEVILADNEMEVVDYTIKVGCWRVTHAQAQAFFTKLGYYGGRKPKVGTTIVVDPGVSQKAHITTVDRVDFFSDDRPFKEVDDLCEIEGSADFDELFAAADKLAALKIIKAKKN